MASSRKYEVTLIIVPENFCISALPNIPKDTNENRVGNSAIIFLEGINRPKLINTKCFREGSKVKADEYPKAFTMGSIDEEVETVFFGSTERTFPIVMHVTV